MTLTILGSPKIPVKVDDNTIYRDIAIYIVSTLLVLGMGWLGHLTWWTSASMLVLYVVLVVIVYV